MSEIPVRPRQKADNENWIKDSRKVDSINPPQKVKKYIHLLGQCHKFLNSVNAEVCVWVGGWVGACVRLFTFTVKASPDGTKQ